MTRQVRHPQNQETFRAVGACPRSASGWAVIAICHTVFVRDPKQAPHLPQPSVVPHHHRAAR